MNTCETCGHDHNAFTDLMDALEEMMECHRTYCEQHGPGISETAICMVEARRALAQARGEEVPS